MTVLVSSLAQEPLDQGGHGGRRGGVGQVARAPRNVQMAETIEMRVHEVSGHLIARPHLYFRGWAELIM